MYNYVIARDLCKSCFTHVPCGQTWRGLDKIRSHLEECRAEITVDLDPIYAVPGLDNTVYTFGWCLLLDGTWHLEVGFNTQLYMLPVLRHQNSNNNFFGK